MSRFFGKTGKLKKAKDTKSKKDKSKKDKGGKSKSKKGKSKKGKKLQDSPARGETSGQASTSKPQTPCPYAVTGVPTDPCFLYKMVIREEWPAAKEEQKKKAQQRDPAEVDKEIRDKQRELWKKQELLDAKLFALPYDASSVERRRKRRDKVQADLLDLIVERTKAAPFKVESPSTNVREFTILKKLPENYEARKEAAEEILEELREELKILMRDWHTAHTEHEQAKKDLLELSKTLEKLAVKRNSRSAAEAVAKKDRDEKKAALDDYESKQDHSATRSWKGFKRGLENLVRTTPEQKYEAADAKYAKAKTAHSKAKAEYDSFSKNAHIDAKTREKAKREEGYDITLDIREKIADIETQEASVLELRNTLKRGGQPIQMVGGAGGKWWTPWNLNEYKWETSKKNGKSETTGPTKDDDTPTVTVEVDVDQKPEAPTQAEGYQDYCTKPVRFPQGDHPYLRVYESQNEFLPDDDKIGEGGDPLKFKVWQFRQFESGAEKVERAKIGFGLSLKMAKTFFRILEWVMSGKPKKRYYSVEASTCGFYEVGGSMEATGSKTDNHAARLFKKIEVFPADSWQIAIKANAFCGTGYEYEHKVQDAHRPQAETGNLEYESSGSEREETKSETYTQKTMWGTQSTTVSTSDIVGTGGGADKNIHETTVTTRDGSDVTKTTVGTGTYRGQDYTGVFAESATLDAFGSKTGTQRGVVEHGELTEGADAELSVRQGKLDRAPSMPGSFFPMCPVDISFSRNGAEDEVTQNIKNCVGTIVFLIRKTAECVGRVGNIVPSMGWKFGFQADFLAGTLSYFNQFREHIDRRVYMYRRGTLDITIVSLKVYIFGGFWIEFIVGEIKLGAEINIKGKVGIKGHIENTHPDAQNTVNIGFGPTGGIGCGGEIMLVIGSPDWCRAGGGVATSISVEGMYWIKHTEGPHFDYIFKFDGVKFYLVATLVLVGSWERVWKVAKERTLKEGRFPEAFDNKDLEKQSAEMDAHCLEDAEEATKTEKRMKKVQGMTPEDRTKARTKKLEKSKARRRGRK